MSGTEQSAADTQPEHDAEQRTPQIYVASLSDYNNGLLHGIWLDANDTVEGLQEGIDVMLTTSPWAERSGQRAEEWRIDDIDGWGRIEIGEHESLATIARLAEGLATYGDAFGAWASLLDDKATEELAAFEGHYLGEYASLEEYGESVVEDLGIDVEELAEALPEGLQRYLRFDAAAWARDLELGGAIVASASARGVYVFCSG